MITQELAWGAVDHLLRLEGIDPDFVSLVSITPHRMEIHYWDSIMGDVQRFIPFGPTAA